MIQTAYNQFYSLFVRLVQSSSERVYFISQNHTTPMKGRPDRQSVDIIKWYERFYDLSSYYS